MKLLEQARKNEQAWNDVLSGRVEYRVGYEPVGASGPVHTKPLSYEFALSEYRAMRRQRRWRDYYKRIWVESRPIPEPWTEVEIAPDTEKPAEAGSPGLEC